MDQGLTLVTRKSINCVKVVFVTPEIPAAGRRAGFFMPTRAPKPCAHPGCGRLTSATYCPAHKAAHQREQAARKRQYETSRPNAAARGYGSKWRKASKGFLAKHRVCGYCESAPSTLVDHRIPHRGDMTLFWDRSNWVPSCKTCHDAKTARQDGGFGNAPRRC